MASRGLMQFSQLLQSLSVCASDVAAAIETRTFSILADASTLPELQAVGTAVARSSLKFNVHLHGFDGLFGRLRIDLPRLTLLSLLGLKNTLKFQKKKRRKNLALRPTLKCLPCAAMHTRLL